jgi:predicted transcriptional regulator
VVVPVNRTQQEVQRSVRDVDQDSFYKCICELFEMGAKFTRTASGFDVVYPADRETDVKRYEPVLRSDIHRSLQLLIRFGLVPRSYKTEKKQQSSGSILSPV